MYSQKLKDAGISIEVHDDHFGKNVKDVVWLPEVGERGWVVLTKDDKISKNALERIAVAQAQIKMFIFASQHMRGEDMAEVFIKTIVRMQEFVRKHPAPFIAKIYRDGRVEMWKDHRDLSKELKHFLLRETS